MENNVEELHFKAVRSCAFLLFCSDIFLTLVWEERNESKSRLSVDSSFTCTCKDRSPPQPAALHPAPPGGWSGWRSKTACRWELEDSSRRQRLLCHSPAPLAVGRDQRAVGYLSASAEAKQKKQSTHSRSCFIIIWPFYCCPKNLLNMFTSWMLADSVPAGGWQGVRVIFLPTVEKRLVNLNLLETILSFPNASQAADGTPCHETIPNMRQPSVYELDRGLKRVRDV